MILTSPRSYVPEASLPGFGWHEIGPSVAHRITSLACYTHTHPPPPNPGPPPRAHNMCSMGKLLWTKPVRKADGKQPIDHRFVNQCMLWPSCQFFFFYHQVSRPVENGRKKKPPLRIRLCCLSPCGCNKKFFASTGHSSNKPKTDN